MESNIRLSGDKEMKVTLLASTPNARKIAFTAIRTCYSPNTPSELFFGKEYEKYMSRKASDGKDGTDVDRLFRQIVSSKHTSTLEHVVFTFGIEGVSRSLLAQLTRHRIGFSFSVQSQRYVSDKSDGRKGGFDWVVPPSIFENEKAFLIYHELMINIQDAYDELKELGIPSEDCRFVLPNAATTNITMTINLRSLLDFYSKRKKGRGAQWEIANLAEKLREAVVDKEPWVDGFFEII